MPETAKTILKSFMYYMKNMYYNNKKNATCPFHLPTELLRGASHNSWAAFALPQSCSSSCSFLPTKPLQMHTWWGGINPSIHSWLSRYVIREAASGKTHQPSFSPCPECLCSQEIASVTLFSLQDFPGINNGHSFLCATRESVFISQGPSSSPTAFTWGVPTACLLGKVV